MIWNRNNLKGQYYLTSNARAIMAEATGQEALVPSKVSVHPPTVVVAWMLFINHIQDKSISQLGPWNAISPFHKNYKYTYGHTTSCVTIHCTSHSCKRPGTRLELTTDNVELPLTKFTAILHEHFSSYTACLPSTEADPMAIVLILVQNPSAEQSSLTRPPFPEANTITDPLPSLPCDC